MVTPELRRNGMSVNFDVPVQRLQVELCITRIIAQHAQRLSEQNDEDLHSSFTQLLKHTIKSVDPVADVVGSFQQKVGSHPPISDADLFPGFIQLIA